MGLATDLVRFFNAVNIPKNAGNVQVQSINDFHQSNSHYDLIKVAQYCSILEREGVILRIGARDHSFVGPTFITKDFSPKNENYESYELLCEGFYKVRERFQNSVYPVIATKEDGSHDIGTAFYIQTVKGMFIVTALHCIEKMKNVDIPLAEGHSIKPLSVFKSSHKYVDIALIRIDPINLEVPPSPFLLGESQTLDSILTMGYPPIPGFNAFQIADISTINSTVRSSNGYILGNENSYLDGLDYLLINARVKGGNSGSPLINKMGFVSGVLVNIPTSSDDNEKLDQLGYGLGLGSIEIERILNCIDDKNSKGIYELSFEIDENGFKLI